MDKDKFWELIENSQKNTEECQEQAEYLIDNLSEFDSEEIIHFDLYFPPD